MGSTNRVSQACNPCRAKKRRCDGIRPICGLCSRLNTECQYKTLDSRFVNGPRAHGDGPTKPGDGPGTPGKSSSSLTEPSPRHHPDRISALRANSGAISADLVRQDIDSSGRSTHTAPFNLGIRTEKSSCQAKPIYEFISLAEYDRITPAYFEKVHVLQGTFSEALFHRKKKELWGKRGTGTAHDDCQSECFDLLFATVGCIGALFSGGSPYEAALIECTTLHLHAHLIQECISAYDVDGLLLRTLYLRMTAGVRAAWLSSCILVTTLQDSLFRVKAGPHSSGVRGSIYEIDHHDVPEAPDILHEKRYRLAKNINDWISNETGRPKAFSSTFPYRGVPISELAVGPGWEMLHLAEMSQRLDPDDYDMDAESLEKFLGELFAFTTNHDFVLTSQINLANMVFRRLRSLGAKPSSEHVSRLVSLCCLGLDAVSRLAVDRQPWHHIASAPFQILCTFLLLDTRESLSKVAHALGTIRRVCECFPTPTMMNTVQTATHLVDLARQRKEQDSADLSTASALTYGGGGGGGGSAAAAYVTPAADNRAPEDDGAAALPGTAAVAASTTMDGLEMSPGLLEADFSSWDNIDWDQVLRTNAMFGPLQT